MFSPRGVSLCVGVIPVRLLRVICPGTFLARIWSCHVSVCVMSLVYGCVLVLWWVILLCMWQGALICSYSTGAALHSLHSLQSNTRWYFMGICARLCVCSMNQLVRITAFFRVMPKRGRPSRRHRSHGGSRKGPGRPGPSAAERDQQLEGESRELMGSSGVKWQKACDAAVKVRVEPDKLKGRAPAFIIGRQTLVGCSGTGTSSRSPSASWHPPLVPAAAPTAQLPGVIRFWVSREPTVRSPPDFFPYRACARLRELNQRNKIKLRHYLARYHNGK